MPIKLENPIIKQTTTTKQVDFIDIVGEIRIDVDRQRASFFYGEFQYIRDESNNILTRDNKKRARRIDIKRIELTTEQYLVFFNSRSDKILAKAMEDAMIEAIQGELESGEEIQYMESNDYIVG